jgi:hypothetical protein
VAEYRGKREHGTSDDGEPQRERDTHRRHGVARGKQLRGVETSNQSSCLAEY